MHDEIKDIAANNHKKFQEVVKGKTVIFVGPANTLEGKGQGKIIDEYDLVVRTNDGIDVAKQSPGDYGSRCDAIFLNNSWCRRKLKDFQFPKELKFIFLKAHSASIGYKRKDLRSKITMARSISRKNKLRQLWREDNALKEPLQSSHVAYNIVDYKVAQLTFTGIDFYESKQSWHKAYNVGIDQNREKHIRTKGHSLRGEKRYIKALLEKGYLESDSKVLQILNLRESDSKFILPKAKIRPNI
jgi:hypothetical protein